MTDRKVIAVVGARGAQGGGLSRAILADPDGGFAVRGLTRYPGQGGGTGACRGRRGGRPGRPRRPGEPRARFRGRLRRVLRDELLGALLGREGDRAGRQHGRGGEGGGVQHVIWSTLEDTRELRAARRRPDADAAGEVQGAALRRARRRPTRVFTRRGRADDVPAHRVLLGELHLLRRSDRSAARREARAHVPDGRREAARDRRGGHRQGRAYGDLQGRRTEFIGKTVASPAST